MKRFRTVVLLLLLALGGLLVYILETKGTVLTLTFTAADLQHILERRFPIQKSDLLLTTTFSNPRVILKEGSNLIGLHITVTVKLIGQKPLGGNLLAEGQIRYVPAEGTFYFDNGKVQQIQIEGLPQDMGQTVEHLAAPLLDTYLTHIVLYRLKPEHSKEALAKTVLKSAEIRNGRLVLQIGLNQ